MFTDSFARSVGLIQHRIEAEARISTRSRLVLHLSLIAETHTVSVPHLGTVTCAATHSPISPIAPRARTVFRLRSQTAIFANTI